MRCCWSDWHKLCLFCCYQPSCVVSQQRWFELFFWFISIPIPLPTDRVFRHMPDCIERDPNGLAQALALGSVQMLGYTPSAPLSDDKWGRGIMHSTFYRVQWCSFVLLLFPLQNDNVFDQDGATDLGFVCFVVRLSANSLGFFLFYNFPFSPPPPPETSCPWQPDYRTSVPATCGPGLGGGACCWNAGFYSSWRFSQILI